MPLKKAGGGETAEVLDGRKPTDIGGKDVAGMALQCIAQAVVLSVQDAANHLRNLRTLHTAAFGRHLLKMQSAGDLDQEPPELQAIDNALEREKAAFHDYCARAALVLEQLPAQKTPVPPAPKAVSGAHAFPETAEVPAIAMGDLYQTMGHSFSIMAQNSVTAQQQQNSLAQAAANQGVMQIYSLDTSVSAEATESLFNK